MDSRKGALAALRKNLRSTDEDFSPVKEVKVMADSKKGLEEGLSKAKELMQSGAVDEMAHEAEEMMDESHEEKDYSDEALAMMSREELIECIKKMRDSEDSEESEEVEEMEY